MAQGLLIALTGPGSAHAGLFINRKQGFKRAVFQATVFERCQHQRGTDAVIRRAGDLARGKLTVVKVAKPDQDMRFDVPVVGVPTIRAMADAGATCLAVTAGKTLIFDRDSMIELADRNKIAIVGAPAETIAGKPS